MYAHVAEHRDHDEYSGAEQIAIEYAERFALAHLELDDEFFVRLARALQRRRHPRPHDLHRGLPGVRAADRGAAARPGVLARVPLTPLSSEARPLLFSPLRIGPLNAPNRIVCGAHFTQFTEPATTVGEPGLYGERYGRYLAEYGRPAARASSSPARRRCTRPPRTRCATTRRLGSRGVPHFERSPTPIHEHGALAFLQLAHNGGVNDGTWSKLPVWSPSGIANHIEPPQAARAATRSASSSSTSPARRANAAARRLRRHRGARRPRLPHPRVPLARRATTAPTSTAARSTTACASRRGARGRAHGGRRRRGRRAPARRRRGAARRLGPRRRRRRRDRAPGSRTPVSSTSCNVSVGTSGMGMVRPLYAPHLLGVYAAHTVKKARAATRRCSRCTAS